MTGQVTGHFSIDTVRLSGWLFFDRTSFLLSGRVNPLPVNHLVVIPDTGQFLILECLVVRLVIFLPDTVRKCPVVSGNVLVYQEASAIRWIRPVESSRRVCPNILPTVRVTVSSFDPTASASSTLVGGASGWYFR